DQDLEGLAALQLGTGAFAQGEIAFHGQPTQQAGNRLGVAEPVASLVDARTLKSNFSLDESTSPELKLGQPLEVLVDAYPGRSFPARISAIDPLIGKSRTVQVQALLDNPEGLLAAGMFASIRVSRKADAPSLSVPETAVTYTAYGDTVFV
ncbi:efflux RND transporter periplasmic adaptor subunit, partial [Pseudomonas aeruginosa]